MILYTGIGMQCHESTKSPLNSDSTAGISSDEKWLQMVAARRLKLLAKEKVRRCLIREWSGSVSGPRLRQACEAIHAFDFSWKPPRSIKQRRLFLTNWLADNSTPTTNELSIVPRHYQHILTITRLSYISPQQDDFSSGEMKQTERLSKDYICWPQTLRQESETKVRHNYQNLTVNIRANRTHAFCYVGFRYLLTTNINSFDGDKDENATRPLDRWVELEVTSCSSKTHGDHIGAARVVAVSNPPPVFLTTVSPRHPSPSQPTSMAADCYTTSMHDTASNNNTIPCWSFTCSPVPDACH